MLNLNCPYCQGLCVPKQEEQERDENRTCDETKANNPDSDDAKDPPNNNEPSWLASRWNGLSTPAKVAVGVGGAVAVGGVALAGGAAALTAYGFTSSGIAAGSSAAAAQSAMGNVVAGSWFAFGQSLGATGALSAATTTGAAAAAGGAAAATVAGATGSSSGTTSDNNGNATEDEQPPPNNNNNEEEDNNRDLGNGNGDHHDNEIDWICQNCRRQFRAAPRGGDVM